MSFNTQYKTDKNTKIVNLDTRSKFHSGETKCEFNAKFMNDLYLSERTDIYLIGIYIGGYKQDISGYGTNTINAFSIKIPEFNIQTIGADASGTTDSSGEISYSTNLDRSIVLPMEQVKTGVHTRDYRPFVLGHISKTAVYVSTIEPSRLVSVKVNISDQDNNDIWISTDNPPLLSRRVILQFAFIPSN